MYEYLYYGYKAYKIYELYKTAEKISFYSTIIFRFFIPQNKQIECEDDSYKDWIFIVIED